MPYIQGYFPSISKGNILYGYNTTNDEDGNDRPNAFSITYSI